MADAIQGAAGGCGQADTGTASVGSERVLIEEYCWLNPGTTAPADLEDYYRTVRDYDQAALCLSGGGIRSAAFALGVLQALSRRNLLTGFHYLSTVSGGGYIGSFVQRWIKEHKGGAKGVMAALASPAEPEEIKRLRQNSNFITPRVGLGSTDTWTAVAISLRNIIINWMLFLPLFLIAAVLPNWFLSGVDSVPTAVAGTHEFDDVLLYLAAASIGLSVAFTVPMLPSYRTERVRIAPGSGDGWIFSRIVLPILLWAVFGTLAASADLLLPVPGDATSARLGPVEWSNGTALATWTLIGMAGGLLVGALFVHRGRKLTFASHLVGWLLSFAVVAGWVWIGFQLFSRYVPKESAKGWPESLLTVLGPLWLLGATLLGSVIFAAVSSVSKLPIGEQPKPDADREFIARVSGIKFKPMLAWALAGFSALLLMTLLLRWTGGNELSVSALVALLAGGGTVAGGKSQESGGPTSGAGSYILRFLPLQALVAIGTLVFVAAMFVFLAALEMRLIGLFDKQIAYLLKALEMPHWVDPEVVAHSVLLLALIPLLWWLGRLISVNRFSLNGLYRNRLARAFLGAAHLKRTPNPFTGFDSEDNVRMHLLRKNDKGETPAPRVLYPVVNCALNVSATENLAWQERKAEPFIFSPLYSGGGELGPRDPATGRARGAYVSSSCYGGNEKDLGLGGNSSGVSLATAVSISGAAASPNMGYHSSPATAFLMTLFNVRLGAWLPNPARADDLGKDVMRSGPKNSVGPLLRELAGSTDDRGRDVYLSDGGHFENLAVYEMLRRRCRYIFVTDAGADPACAFGDLGGLVRKAKIDFDVDIDFGRMCIAGRHSEKKPEPQLAWAVGKVTYPGGAVGTILYLKPSYFGDALPVDIVSYANDSQTFPHESTGDQFFSESQFESYRHLGDYLASRLAPGFVPPAGGESDVAGFFEAAAGDYEKTMSEIPGAEPARRLAAAATSAGAESGAAGAGGRPASGSRPSRGGRSPRT